MTRCGGRTKDGKKKKTLCTWHIREKNNQDAFFSPFNPRTCLRGTKHYSLKVRGSSAKMVREDSLSSPTQNGEGQLKSATSLPIAFFGLPYVGKVFYCVNNCVLLAGVLINQMDFSFEIKCL